MLSRLALSLALLAAPLAAQALPPPVSTAPREDLVKVAIDTSEGRILVALDRGRAPITVANFLHYVDTHRYNGQTFYRAMPYGKGGLIQAGITTDARKLLPPIADEPTAKTGLHNVRGTLAMARAEPGSARSDFFILTTDIPGFDAGAPGGDADGFAAFGHVVEGMDVVEKIFRDPVSPTKGEGAMKGQMLEPAVKILQATRVK
ncbi:MAG: peptidylprolyl isomerase [Sphingomonadales bacterium]|nr:peptidylprolyl isomerase [Sphingomonadales bacterium]